MCGIFGWIKPRLNFTHNLDLDIITRKGMLQTMTRGKDATGFYCPTLGVNKSAVSADKFEVPSVKHDRFFLGHCRAASVGSAFTDVNAHPFECGHLVQVHNGTCRDVKELKDYEYEGQTDSEVVLSYIHKYGVKEGIERSGATGVLVINDRATNRVYFWNDGSRTLELCRYRGLIFFASTRAIIRTSLGITKVMGLFDDANWYRVDDRELLCFDMYKSRNKFLNLGVTKESKVSVKVFKYGGSSYTPAYGGYDEGSTTVMDTAVPDGEWDPSYIPPKQDIPQLNGSKYPWGPHTKHTKNQGKHPRTIKGSYDFTNQVPSGRRALPRHCGSSNPPTGKDIDPCGNPGLDI